MAVLNAKKGWEFKAGLVILALSLLGAGCKRGGSEVSVGENLTNKSLSKESVEKALKAVKSEFNWADYRGDEDNSGDWIVRKYPLSGDKTYHEYISVKQFRETTADMPSWDTYEYSKKNNLKENNKFVIGFEAEASCQVKTGLSVYPEGKWLIESYVIDDNDCAKAFKNFKLFWENL